MRLGQNSGRGCLSMDPLHHQSHNIPGVWGLNRRHWWPCMQPTGDSASGNRGLFQDVPENDEPVLPDTDDGAVVLVAEDQPVDGPAVHSVPTKGVARLIVPQPDTLWTGARGKALMVCMSSLSYSHISPSMDLPRIDYCAISPTKSSPLQAFLWLFTPRPIPVPPRCPPPMPSIVDRPLLPMIVYPPLRLTSPAQAPGRSLRRCLVGAGRVAQVPPARRP